MLTLHEWLSRFELAGLKFGKIIYQVISDISESVSTCNGNTNFWTSGADLINQHWKSQGVSKNKNLASEDWSNLQLSQSEIMLWDELPSNFVESGILWK